MQQKGLHFKEEAVGSAQKHKARRSLGCLIMTRCFALIDCGFYYIFNRRAAKGDSADDADVPIKGGGTTAHIER
jgi:hypothetical protein